MNWYSFYRGQLGITYQNLKFPDPAVPWAATLATDQQMLTRGAACGSGRGGDTHTPTDNWLTKCCKWGRDTAALRGPKNRGQPGPLPCAPRDAARFRHCAETAQSAMAPPRRGAGGGGQSGKGTYFPLLYFVNFLPCVRTVHFINILIFKLRAEREMRQPVGKA